MECFLCTRLLIKMHNQMLWFQGGERGGGGGVPGASCRFARTALCAGVRIFLGRSNH